MIDTRSHGLRTRLTWKSVRAWDALRKVASGFPLHSECVWPGRATDLFVAHRSIYDFFARSTEGKRVLDAGCGAGYGSRALLDLGATRVHGVDIEPRHILYARKRYATHGLTFGVGNCERLALTPDSYDLVVSSNVMEHLEHPEAFLDAARAGLSPGGTLLIAVPWIVDERSRAHSGSNEFHRSNLTIAEWIQLFDRQGWSTRLWLQLFDPQSGTPDFFDPTRTSRTVRDFPFLAVSLQEVEQPHALGVVFHLELAEP